MSKESNSEFNKLENFQPLELISEGERAGQYIITDDNKEIAGYCIPVPEEGSDNVYYKIEVTSKSKFTFIIPSEDQDFGMELTFNDGKLESTSPKLDSLKINKDNQNITDKYERTLLIKAEDLLAHTLSMEVKKTQMALPTENSLSIDDQKARSAEIDSIFKTLSESEIKNFSQLQFNSSLLVEAINTTNEKGLLNVVVDNIDQAGKKTKSPKAFELIIQHVSHLHEKYDNVCKSYPAYQSQTKSQKTQNEKNLKELQLEVNKWKASPVPLDVNQLNKLLDKVHKCTGDFNNGLSFLASKTIKPNITRKTTQSKTADTQANVKFDSSGLKTSKMRPLNPHYEVTVDTSRPPSPQDPAPHSPGTTDSGGRSRAGSDPATLFDRLSEGVKIIQEAAQILRDNMNVKSTIDRTLLTSNEPLTTKQIEDFKNDIEKNCDSLLKFDMKPVVRIRVSNNLKPIAEKLDSLKEGLTDSKEIKNIFLESYKTIGSTQELLGLNNKKGLSR